MAKGYDFNYHLSGVNCHCGDMTCVVCHKPIDPLTQDWVSYRKDDRYGDWRFLTKHRQCFRNDSGWREIENRIAKNKEEVSELVKVLRKYVEKDGYMNDIFYKAIDELGVEL